MSCLLTLSYADVRNNVAVIKSGRMKVKLPECQRAQVASVAYASSPPILMSLSASEIWNVSAMRDKFGARAFCVPKATVTAKIRTESKRRELAQRAENKGFAGGVNTSGNLRTHLLTIDATHSHLLKKWYCSSSEARPLW